MFGGTSHKQLLVVSGELDSNTQPIWDHFTKQGHDVYKYEDLKAAGLTRQRPYVCVSFFAVATEHLPDWRDLFQLLSARTVSKSIVNVHLVLRPVRPELPPPPHTHLTHFTHFSGIR